MAEGRGKDAWAHTSAIMALIANAHRDPKKNKPFTPADFNPYLRRPETPTEVLTDLSILKTVFVDR